MSGTTEQATFGGGCFWCTEAVFQRVRGVSSVVSGYAGGAVERPGYEQVCTGATGHAEVVQITFDPEVVSYSDLLDIFFATHDPTTLNRQGNDAGTQYRSAIFYHNDEQRRLAEEARKRAQQSGEFHGPIVTEIVPLPAFYPAEDYHQNYFRLNERQPYCNLVIRPKLEKFEKRYHERLQASG
jgi:peptide-methionine (S)-S-oxide reductase